MGAGDFFGPKWTLPRSKWEEAGVEVHAVMAQSSCFWVGVKTDSGNTLHRYTAGHNHPVSRQKGPGGGGGVSSNIKHE